MSQIVIAIAVTVATAGSGTAGVVAAMGTAASASAATMALTATINSGLNGEGLGGVYDRLNNDATWQNIATATVTAGVTSGISSQFATTINPVTGLPQATSYSLSTMAGAKNLLTLNLVNGVASSVVTTGINGGSFGDYLTNSLTVAVTNTVGAMGFNASANHLDLGWERVLGHATVGAATGYLLGEDGGSALAGAAGAAAGYGLSNGLNGAGLSNDQLSGASQVAGVLASTLITGDGDYASTGQNAASLEFQYNYLKHNQQDALSSKLKQCSTQQCKDNVIAEYNRISRQQDKAMNDCLVAGDRNCYQQHVENILEADRLYDTRLTQQLGVSGAGLVNNSSSLTNNPLLQSVVNASRPQTKVDDTIGVLVDLKDYVQDYITSGGNPNALGALAYVVTELTIPTTVTETALFLTGAGKVAGKATKAGDEIIGGLANGDPTAALGFAGFGGTAKASGKVAAGSADATRTVNGIELDARLPDPKAGLDYKPNVLDNSNPSIANSQVNGFNGELKLGNEIAATPDQVVISYADKVGLHGADAVSVNAKTGEVTLWDNKYRSNSVSIDESSTFANRRTLDAARNQAIIDIQDSKLPANVKDQAIQNLEKGTFKMRTVGDGNVKNSVLSALCNNKPC